ncbi:hypothetical protein GCM10010332_50710 [Streptomyces albogriseolus]|nr:hypothetical protein GCM10010332_50710 [Streptomyces albogriseolus]
MLALQRGYGITYPSIFGPGRPYPAGFRCMAPRALPTAYVLDRSGKVAAFSFGPLTFRDFFPIIQCVAAGRRRPSNPAGCTRAARADCLRPHDPCEGSTIMSSTSSRKTKPSAAAAKSTAAARPTKGERRRARAAEQAAAARRAEQRARRLRWGGAALAVVAVAAGGVFLTTRGDGGGGSSSGSATRPLVGGDLHTVSVVGSRLYVGGHAAVAASGNGGKTWQDVPSLRGADAMGWASTNDAVLVGGHPGLYRSTDGGATFTKVTGKNALGDVHAIGGAGDTVYVGSPESGLLASTDGGTTWKAVNVEAGRSFMGTILVDPKDPQRLIAPDMSSGLQTSADGGKTWKELGGPMGAMAAAWNPKDINRIIAVGMDGAQLSTDGGKTWKDADVPKGTSAVGYDATGSTLYAGALDGKTARVYRSTDGGTSWKATS